MKIESGKLERLRFLSRVIEKESHHLAVSLSRVFKEPFTVERAKTAYSNEDFSESLEAFTSRFARLQRIQKLGVDWVRLPWRQKLGVGWVEERNPTPRPAHVQIPMQRR